MALALAACTSASSSSDKKDAAPPVAPAAPANLAATEGNSAVALTWTAVDGATGYTVYRGPAQGLTPASGTKVNATPAPEASYTDSPTADNSTYYYIVTALNAGGESGASNEASVAVGPAGALDTTFNSTGFATQIGTAGGTTDVGNSVAFDSQGRIVVTGTSDGTSAGFMAVWRYTASGSLDTSFNTTGIVTKLGTAGGQNERAVSLTVDSQDRIVASGFSRDVSFYANLAIWRYTAAGSLDTTFNGTGFVTKLGTAGGTSDSGAGIALDRQGRIVVAGKSYDATSDYNLAVWRYFP